MFLSTSALSLFISLAVILAAVKGQDNVASSARIVNGVTAESMPTCIVSIHQFIEAEEKLMHVGGGTIISNTRVLTASSIFHLMDPSQFIVKVGSRDLTSPLSAFYNVMDCTASPKYNLGNNMAVVTVSPDITMGPYVSVAVIAPAVDIKAHDVVLMYGWGKVDTNAFLPTLKVQELQTVVQPNNVCQQYYPNLNMTSAMCTFNRLGVGACVGDAGGPVVLKSTGQVVGVISNARLPCGTGSPDVSTRIGPNWKFIESANGKSNAGKKPDQETL